MSRATDLGCRAYSEGCNFGAIAEDGRECRIVWHGQHRRELLLMYNDKCLRKQMFVTMDEHDTFTEAAHVGITFLEERAAHKGRILTSVEHP